MVHAAQQCPEISSLQMGGNIKPPAAAQLPSTAGRSVTILLCTLNGERFLAEQLALLERQTFKNWKLIASDDGSSDQIHLAGLQKVVRARRGSDHRAMIRGSPQRPHYRK